MGSRQICQRRHKQPKPTAEPALREPAPNSPFLRVTLPRKKDRARSSIPNYIHQIYQSEISSISLMAKLVNEQRYVWGNPYGNGRGKGCSAYFRTAFVFRKIVWLLSKPNKCRISFLLSKKQLDIFLSQNFYIRIV